jgi:hypothetical protein
LAPSTRAAHMTAESADVKLATRPKAHRPLLLTGPHRAPAGITLGTLQPERSKNAQDHVRSQLSADLWRAERQDDNGPGEQPGPSLKDPLHVTFTVVAGAGNVQEAQVTCTEGRLLRQHRQHRLRLCSRVDGCRLGLHLLDRAAVGLTEGSRSLSQTMLTVLTVFSALV